MSLSLEDEILKLTLVSDEHYLIQPLEDKREAVGDDQSDDDESEISTDYGSPDEDIIEDAKDGKTRPLTQTQRQMFSNKHAQRQAEGDAEERARADAKAKTDAERLAAAERQEREKRDAEEQARRNAEEQARREAEKQESERLEAEEQAPAPAPALAPAPEPEPEPEPDPEPAPAANISDEDEEKRPEDSAMLNTYKTDKFRDVDFVSELREQIQPGYEPPEAKQTKNDITNDLNAGIYITKKTSQRWILVIHKGRKLLRGPFKMRELAPPKGTRLQTYDITDKSTVPQPVTPHPTPSNSTPPVRRSKRTRKQHKQHNVGGS